MKRGSERFRTLRNLGRYHQPFHPYLHTPGPFLGQGHQGTTSPVPPPWCCRMLGCVPYCSKGVTQLSQGLGLPLYSHIIHVAGVGHLLDVDPGAWGSPSVHPHHCLLHQVLDVHEAPPDVAQVTEGVSCRAWVPKPGGRARCWHQGTPGNQHRWPWTQAASPNLSLILLVLVTSSMSMRIL